MKVLFVPYHIGGHTHAMIGLASELRRRGHEPIFYVDQSKKSLLKDFRCENRDLSRNPHNEYLFDRRYKISARPIDIIKLLIVAIEIIYHFIRATIDLNKKLSTTIKKIDPDIIIVDDFHYPSISKSGKPWVAYWSANPIIFMETNDQLPFGFELKNSFVIRLLNTSSNLIRSLTECIAYKLCGYGLKYNSSRRSPYLNFYCYPKEIDYVYDQNVFKNTLNLETSLSFPIDNQLEDRDLLKFIEKSDKLVLVSFGSYVATNIEFMKKVVKILSKSKHRFIVSKGVNHCLYELSGNMWGNKYIDQIQVLPYVDLVINHGGNNTFTESIAFGKPQIIIPFLVDQFDNAMRVRDCNIGVYIKYDDLCQDNLLNAIDYLIDNQQIKNKLTNISQRIQKENKVEQAAKSLEKLVIKDMSRL